MRVGLGCTVHDSAVLLEGPDDGRDTVVSERRREVVRMRPLAITEVVSDACQEIEIRRNRHIIGAHYAQTTWQYLRQITGRAGLMGGGITTMFRDIRGRGVYVVYKDGPTPWFWARSELKHGTKVRSGVDRRVRADGSRAGGVGSEVVA